MEGQGDLVSRLIKGDSWGYYVACKGYTYTY